MNKAPDSTIMTSPWKSEEVFHQGDPFFDRLIQALKAAEHSIELETFIFDRDRLGNMILDELAAAASRGVRVMLLLDGFGCSKWTYGAARGVRRRGIDVEIFHPLPWQVSPMHLFGATKRLIRNLSALNRRDHRKCCIIDQKIAFIGGMNISSRHLESHHGRQAWRDSGARIEGDPAQALHLAFNDTWASKQRSVQAASVRLNTTHRLRVRNHRALARAIARAKSRVWITTPYFAPDWRILRAIRRTARKGTDVRILLPAKNDVPISRWIAQAFYRTLLGDGVRVYEYLPRVLHAKITILDDWAMIGSSNLNHRSLFHDLEADVVLRSSQSILSLERQFELDLEHSRSIGIAAWAKRSFWQKALESLASFLKRWA